MNFDDALAAVRAGKCALRASQPIQWAYMKQAADGSLRWYGYGDRADWSDAASSPVQMRDRELNAQDWVIVDEGELQAWRPPAVHNCPRRGESFRVPAVGELLDYWRDGHGHRECGYCGSMHPDDFMAHLEAGTAKLGPTDKNYKVYVDVPDPRAGQLRLMGSANFAKEGDGWIQATAEHEPLGATIGDWILLGPREATQTEKFYFQHLDAAQQARFIELHNEGKLKIGYPGHFYAPPFFCRHTEAA